MHNSCCSCADVVPCFLINCEFDFADSGKDINFVTVKGCAIVDIPRQTYE